MTDQRGWDLQLELEPIQIHQREQAAVDCHPLAGFDQAFGHQPADRRAHLGLVEVLTRQRELGFVGAHFGLLHGQLAGGAVEGILRNELLREQIAVALKLLLLKSQLLPAFCQLRFLRGQFLIQFAGGETRQQLAALDAHAGAHPDGGDFTVDLRGQRALRHGGKLTHQRLADAECAAGHAGKIVGGQRHRRGAGGLG